MGLIGCRYKKAKAERKKWKAWVVLDSAVNDPQVDFLDLASITKLVAVSRIFFLYI